LLVSSAGAEVLEVVEVDLLESDLLENDLLEHGVLEVGLDLGVDLGVDHGVELAVERAVEHAVQLSAEAAFQVGTGLSAQPFPPSSLNLLLVREAQRDAAELIVDELYSYSVSRSSLVVVA
jgi:hypothetical protein